MLKTLLSAAALCHVGSALASVPVSAVDAHYFDELNVSEQSSMIIIEMDADNGGWAQFPVYSSAGLRSDQRSLCGLSKEFDKSPLAKLTYGLKPELGTYYFESSVHLLVRSETAEAIELALSPGSKQSLWLSKRDGLNAGTANHYRYTLKPIGDWLASHSGYTWTKASSGDVSLRRAPKAGAPVIVDCRDGVLLNSWNKKDTPVSGRWLYTECVSKGCASATRCFQNTLSDSPDNADASFKRCYTDQPNKCGEGWIEFVQSHRLLFVPDTDADVVD